MLSSPSSAPTTLVDNLTTNFYCNTDYFMKCHPHNNAFCLEIALPVSLSWLQEEVAVALLLFDNVLVHEEAAHAKNDESEDDNGYEHTD